MTQYREILRLTAMGLSQRSILGSVGCSQKAVVKVQRRARELKLSWPLDEAMTDAVLEETLFPKAPKVSPVKQMPDFDYIRRELLRNGVNKKLLLAQSLADMDLVYGREARESVLNNAAYKCNLGVTDRTTQLYFADQAGRYTPDDDIPSAWETFLPERGPRKSRAGSYRVPPEELAYMGENVFLLHPDGYTWLKKHYYYKT